ncbi:MAG: HD domain-containing protein [Candidatus Peribacteraceae bacterium]|nr:HD domain-containing protein [Candidatus Peribacteraceae bacterium]MDD5741979.1 HD domain-containing protein [Candidatus Peribacteraceae bacterium]
MATASHHRPPTCTIVTCHLDPLVPSFTPAIPLTLSSYLTYKDAIAFTRLAHAGQKRADGRAFVSHPLAVLQILRSVSTELPHAAYMTALLHDTVEDTETTVGQIRTTFGDETATAVDALTRRKRPKGKGVVEHERDYLARMAQIHRHLPYVLLIKMADRLHNLETAHFCAPAYRQALLQETATLYLPFLQVQEPLQTKYSDSFNTLYSMLEESVARLTDMPQII